MPIYEYRCDECGREFEALVRGERTPQCPGCASARLSRKLSVFATAQGGSEPAMAAMGPCGSCGHPDGPGACRFDG